MISTFSRNAFSCLYANATRKHLLIVRNSSTFLKCQSRSKDEPKSNIFVRYDSSFNQKEQTTSTGSSNELDSTDPDAIYSKVKYEEKYFVKDTKSREGIASSPDHYSSLDENEQADTLGAKIKKGFSSIFSKK